MLDRVRLASNAAAVRRRVDEACRRARRDPSTVTIVAITKVTTPEGIEALVDLGFRDLGENRVLEGVERIAGISRPARWHFVGHLQTNKVKKALERFEVFHSVDRRELAAAMEKRLAGGNKRVPGFVQVNVSGEASKGGVRPEEVRDFVAWARGECPHLDVRGLMTMAPHENPEASRPVFRRLRELGETCGLRDLSMGMTNDFEVAVEEGATHLRVGSAFFEGVGT